MGWERRTDQCTGSDIPGTVEGEALAWTGDFESPLFVVSVGEDPMVACDGRVWGGERRFVGECRDVADTQ